LPDPSVGRSLGAVTWPSTLDVAGLTSRGWAPKPFHQFVVKIHSRCNLACRYCYVYESADQSWRDQPVLMTDEVFRTACSQIAAHVDAHAVPSISLVLHGGEPLLAGAERLDRFAATATRLLGDRTRLRLGMQTNGLLLDDRMAEICSRRGIRVAVSIDGDATGHDRHRRFRNGRGSYAEVVRGIGILRRARHLYAGLLCTIDVDNDPLATYRALVDFEPPAVDFLLPHGNWTDPPPRRSPGAPPVYGEWLSAIFDEWFPAPVQPTRVRLFEDILALALGGHGSSESVGLSPVRVAVIETDGSIEQVDTLKTAYAGATKVALEAGGNPLDHALYQPPIVARQIGAEALSPTCRDCSIRRICGGGNYTHRYREGSGFLNPSVYCPDLTFLIRHITGRVAEQLTRIGAASHGD
jgi:uncharacterized protein